MTEPALVRRAITLSRRYAGCGNHRAARKVWLTATRLAGRCGGISGGSWAGDGYGAIVLDDGLVALSGAAGRAEPGGCGLVEGEAVTEAATLETADLHRSECDRLAMCGCAPGECAYRAELAERRAARAVWLAAVYAQGAVQSVLDGQSLTVTEPTLILYGVIDRIRLVTGGHAETEARRRLAEISADIRDAIGLWSVWPERLPRIIAALEDVAQHVEWARP